MRSTRQRSKPVVLNLKKTEFGYEIIPEKGGQELHHSKSSISKAEKSGSPSRSKNTDLEGETLNEINNQEPTRLLKTKTLGKTGAGASKNANSGMKGKAKKSPSIQTDIDIQKREEAPSTPISMALGTPVNTGEDSNNNFNLNKILTF